MTMTNASILAKAASSSIHRSWRPIQYGMTHSQHRPIMIGTDMQSSIIALQPARPWHMTESNLAVDHAVSLKDIFANQKRVVLFGVPAPFTGTCTTQHVPGYLKMAPQLQTYVDEIICYSVADPYALYGWSQTLLGKNENDNDDDENKNKVHLPPIRFLADPEATFAKAYGVDSVYDKVSLGLRSKRFSMFVEDGEVQIFHLVEDAVNDAERIYHDIVDLVENRES